MTKNTEESIENTKLDEDVEEIEAASAEPKKETLSIKPKRNWFKRFIGTKKGKVISSIVLVVVAAAVLFAIPATRYAIMGTFMKKSVDISVVDSVTKKPVTEATVTLGEVSGKTDGDGVARLPNVPVGEYTLSIAKNYYELTETPYTVPVIAAPQSPQLEMKATGRQVTINLTHTITRAALTKATVRVQDTSAVTDAMGNAVIVLPADQKTLKGTVELAGYNKKEIEVKVTDQADVNKFTLSPEGSVHYLSKQTGKINVMKSNLDGSNPQVVVEGTGNEKDQGTVLLAARDWRYLTLLADRKGTGDDQLYLLDSESGSLTLIDEGDVYFQLAGWSDHKFSYVITRNDREPRLGKEQALKVFNAETKQLNIIDETQGMGEHAVVAQSEYIGRPYILEGKLVYAKYWRLASGIFLPSDKKSAIILVNMHNEQKQIIQEFSMNHMISIDSKLYEPQEVYFRVSIDGGQAVYYEYEGNSIKSVTNTDDKFYNTYYPTYLVSPSGEKTFWYEPRDGKNALFVGDKNGSNSTELALQSEYTAYGWFSDDYILLSKNGSELYIASSNSLDHEPIKITNYHKPQLSFPGYGYGYGGQ